MLVLASLTQSRSGEGVFAPRDVEALFDEIGLPRPTKMSNVLASLEKNGNVTRMKAGQARWKLTPNGATRVGELTDEMELAGLVAESARPLAVHLGKTAHPVVPPSLAPPALIDPLRAFLAEYPFDKNVFGMTRFPGGPEGDEDPLAPALEVAADVCRRHGLTFHLASDRNIVDDLWANVAAHMWGCRFGIAFFEARSEKGLNYNLNIEVGSCLVLGRRLALLKDESLDAMPTDLVGQIYLSVDLNDPTTVTSALEDWLTKSLKI